MAVSTGDIVTAVPGIRNIIQSNALIKQFEDALHPQQLYRMDCSAQLWEAEAGDRQIFTRSAELTPTIDPIAPGQDPTPENQAYEQWFVQAGQLTKTLDTHLPTNYVAIPGRLMRDTHTLGLNAGKSLNRVCRNKLFCAYAGGQTLVDNSATGTSVVVGSINGFTEVVIDGQILGVSAANPLPVTIGGDAALVEAATPDDAVNFPFGRGTLTLSAAITFVIGEPCVSSQAPTVIYPAAKTDIDGLVTGDFIDLASVRAAVANLRANNVPPHPDGYYHCHLDPLAESQLFSDNEFQRINETRYEEVPYRQFVVGKTQGCLFYTNSESPGVGTVATPLQTSRTAGDGPATLSRDIFAEVTNEDALGILRTVITGGGSIYEQYIDEGRYISVAGVTGQIGSFNITNNGLQIMTDRIRLVYRAPLDRLQQTIAQTWSWTGDFAVPSDVLTGRTAARYKRAVIIAHAAT